MPRSLLVVFTAFLAAAASAQPVQEVGTPGSFDVATWNIEWFGSPAGGPSDDQRQIANVADVIAGAGIDLWALQEVSSPAAFDDLLARLGPPWAGRMAIISGEQRLAYVYRTDVVRVRATKHILEQFGYAFAGRPPFQMELDAMLSDTTISVTLVNVHMKAFSDPESYARRLEASQRLKNRFDFLEARTPLVFLGDLNDQLRTSITAGRPSPYANFMDDAECGTPSDTCYRFLSLPLEDAGVCTFCGSQTSTIDHILVTDELFAAADAGTADRLGSVLDGIPGFLGNTSDHVPVFARLRPARIASHVDSVPEAFGLVVYPVPASDHVRISLDTAGALARSVWIADLLGRVVRRHTLAPGAASARIELSGLAPGLYAILLDGRPVRLLPVR